MFKNSYLFKNDKKKKSCIGITINIYYNKFQKKISKLIRMKNFSLEKKTCNPFLK